MAEGARLESVYTATYRGFESPSPPYLKKSSYESTGFFRILHTPGDEKPRPGFDNWRQPVGQTVNAVSGLPAGRAKRVNPPSPPYLKKSSYESTGFFRVLHTPGDEKPRPGVDNWRQPVGQTVNAVSGLPAGRAKRVNPPSPPYLKKSSYESTGFFRILHTPGAPAHVC